MIKAVICDLDGTIVSSATGRYSSGIRDALAELRQRGIKVIAATGRSPYEFEATKLIDGLNFDAIVCLNGQYCYTDTQELFINPFDVRDAATLLMQLERLGYPCSVIDRDGTYIDKVNDHVRIAQNAVRTPIPPLRELRSFFGKELLMLTVYIPETDEADFLTVIENITVTRWNPYALDIVPKGGGKCTGIEAVLRHFDLSWENVIAFGDGDNDYEMLRHARIGIAMGNSSPALMTGEFDITGTAEEDGVLSALSKYHIY